MRQEEIHDDRFDRFFRKELRGHRELNSEHDDGEGGHRIASPSYSVYGCCVVCVTFVVSHRFAAHSR